jgi:uracil-DNA glycosylase family protein
VTRRTTPSNSPTPERPLASLREDAAGCRRCPLWRRATQTVFGSGAADAEVVLVGEQPGDKEDVAGEPFVGPAGELLRKALAESGLARKRLYLTNAVKHFKWQPRGKRRLHEKPNTAEILACQLWLELELAALQPRLIVALGATAVRSLLGPTARVVRDRGTTISRAEGASVLVTVHPSSILRVPEASARADAYEAFVEDLRSAARAAGRSRPSKRPE